MKLAAEGARVPVMFVQARNDYDTAPIEILAASMRAAVKDAELRLSRRAERRSTRVTPSA